MNPLSKSLAEAHIADLHREAARAGDRAGARRAARERDAAAMPAVTLRGATPADTQALMRLAALDSSDVPWGPLVVAEIGGELRAAISLSDRAVIADPFHPTAALVQLLRNLAEHAAGIRSSRVRRLRERPRRWARRNPDPGLVVQVR